MKKIFAIFVLLVLFSCKKDTVVATNTRTFQSSINDMSSALPTLKQVKFNEALYILKKFAVPGNDDTTELQQLAKLLDGRNVDQIMALADETASKNGMDWKSTGPPMLGEANIFANQGAKEADPNDVNASKVDILIRNIEGDSLSGPKGLRIIPRLTDGSGTPITFSKAALETTMDVFSAGKQIHTAKNLMTDNGFRGFAINYSQLRRSQVPYGKIDVRVAVKTASKTLQFTKMGIVVNDAAMADEQPKTTTSVSQKTEETPQVTDPSSNTEENPSSSTLPVNSASNKSAKDPKTTVTKFLNSLGSKNLKAAYDISKNPNWGSFDSFSNENSGFGAVNSLSVKKINTVSAQENSASVDAEYSVTDKNGKTVPLNVTFSLKNVDGDWKITGYKIK